MYYIQLLLVKMKLKAIKNMDKGTQDKVSFEKINSYFLKK